MGQAAWGWLDVWSIGGGCFVVGLDWVFRGEVFFGTWWFRTVQIMTDHYGRRVIMGYKY